MNDLSTQPIWNAETGITDLEVDPRQFSASQMPGIKAIWTDQRQRLKGSAQLSDFTEKLSREWAIETGIIENLYEIERGVTQTLIEQGFQAELFSYGSTNKPREYVIQLLLDQNDGPMLEALKQLDGGVIHMPNRVKDWPDRDRRGIRFERFKAVA